MCSVVPRTGTALIFNHDTLHEGQPVTKGTKYIIRTEIMYRRVDREMIPDPLAYEKDKNYIKTLALYRKSWELEQGMCVCVYVCMYVRVCVCVCMCTCMHIFEFVHAPLHLYMYVAGDSKGFTDTYLEAIRLQHQAQKSIGPDAKEIFEQNFPYEIYLKIFGYLTARDVCRAMRVCKVHVQ